MKMFLLAIGIYLVVFMIWTLLLLTVTKSKTYYDLKRSYSKMWNNAKPAGKVLLVLSILPVLPLTFIK